MTEIQRAKHEVSMRFWQEAIMNCKASGLTVVAFCRQHELNVHAYYYWQRQIRKELLQKQAAPAEQNKNNPTPNQREQASTTAPSAGRPADIVPFSAALDMAKAEHSPLPSTAVPAITIHALYSAKFRDLIFTASLSFWTDICLGVVISRINVNSGLRNH